MIRRTAMVLVMVAASLAAAFGMAVRDVGAQEDPVQSRLGGRSADFTTKYGEPRQTVDFDAVEDATVSTYEVFGFEEVSTIVYGGRVVGITLRPVAGDTWTEAAAQVVLGDFAPADAEYATDRIALGLDEQGVNRIGIQGSSEGVEDDVDEDVYDDLDAGGEPGDFAVTLFEAVPSFYSEVSIDLGFAGEGGDSDAGASAVVEPAPETGQQGFTLEEQLYFDSVLPLIETMGDSLGRFAEEMEIPRIGQNDWTISVVGELVTWQFVYQESLALVPPPAFEGLHSLLLEGLGKYSDAADLIIFGLDNLDISAIELATALMQEGAGAIQEANALLDVIREERGF